MLRTMPGPRPPYIYICMCVFVVSGGSDGKESACNVGDSGLIPGLGRSLGEGNGNPLQYSCLDNPTDRGTWWATVHNITRSQTKLKHLSMHTVHWAAKSLT